MIYLEPITTPKNTAVSGMQVTHLKVTAGLVYRVEFQFPSGCAGLNGVAVFDGLYQVWPSTPGRFFASDYETIGFEDLYLKTEPPFEFQVYTYNIDDTYDHTISVRLGLVSKEAYIARFLPYRGFEYLTQLIDNLQKEKEQLAAEQAEQLKESPFQWLLRQEGIE